MLRQSFLIALIICCFSVSASASESIVSIDTKNTIVNIATAKGKGGEYIVGNSYEGAIVAASYSGEILWKNDLSGFMNHDIFCGDLTGDGLDEIVVASATGQVFCLNSHGKEMWTFRANHGVMYAICIVRFGGVPYVACGSFDRTLYYLNAKGEKVGEVRSESYSNLSAFGDNAPKGKSHIMNFLRPMAQKDGNDILVAHATNRNAGSFTNIYFFNEVGEKPYFTKSLKALTKECIGWMNVDSEGGKIIFGTDSNSSGSTIFTYDVAGDSFKKMVFKKFGRQMGFGYRTARTVVDTSNGGYFTLLGNIAFQVPENLDDKSTTYAIGKYSYNDICLSQSSGKVVLASSESGGSAIHIIDVKNKKWKESFEDLQPKGNITTIINGWEETKKLLESFKAPKWENTSRKVNFMSESKRFEESKAIIERCEKAYDRLVFSQPVRMDREKWDRMDIPSLKVRKWIDGRMKYTATQEEILKATGDMVNKSEGITFWGGHGNDVNFYRVETLKKIIDQANGKAVNILYPEMTCLEDDFQWSIDNSIMPLTKYAVGRNTIIYVRTKHSYWFTTVYHSMWKNLLSGEYSSVYVPSMEESSCKSMDLNIAARTGFWASGATDSWGARCARDNTAYDGLRRRSHQMVPNHFLRYMIYTISMGATYLDNFAVDQKYMSLLWELIGKGALYVPARDEIVSFSPVHLAMKSPHSSIMYEGNYLKWLTNFDADKDRDDPHVFSHLRGPWAGAPVTEWDFSRYAMGEKERRLTPLPPTENGLVLITPPQKGIFADNSAPRGKMVDKLHPLYKDIMQEFITDGRSYFSADGKEEYSANTYYKDVEAAIKKASKQIPINVSGGAAWVVAQTAPNHLRLTMVDGGYINPRASVATVSFNNIKPLEVRDILSGESFKVSKSGKTQIPISCGGFRFIDVKIEKLELP